MKQINRIHPNIQLTFKGYKENNPHLILIGKLTV